MERHAPLLVMETHPPAVAQMELRVLLRLMEIRQPPDIQMGLVVRHLLMEVRLPQDALMEHQVAQVPMETLPLPESQVVQNLVPTGVLPVDESLPIIKGVHFPRGSCNLSTDCNCLEGKTFIQQVMNNVDFYSSY